MFQSFPKGSYLADLAAEFLDNYLNLPNPRLCGGVLELAVSLFHES
jgi:hypothetical protein